MEKQDYQKIFEDSQNLHGEELKKKLLTFAKEDKQMEEEMKAMFERIDEYYNVIQASKKFEDEDQWVEAQVKEIADLINAKVKESPVTVEEVEQALFGKNEKKKILTN